VSLVGNDLLPAVSSIKVDDNRDNDAADNNENDNGNGNGNDILDVLLCCSLFVVASVVRYCFYDTLHIYTSTFHEMSNYIIFAVFDVQAANYSLNFV